MSGLLRVALVSTAVAMSLGCGFFTLDDDDSSASTGGSGGTSTNGGTGGSNLGGTGGASAGTGTSNGGSGGGSGGSGGSAGTGGGQGGAAGSGAGTGPAGGAGATAAGAGGSAGAAAGGSAGAAMGGMGAGGSGTAGSMSSGGSGPMGCDVLKAGAKAFAGHCYYLQATAANWGAAKAACSGMGAHLVTISSADPLTQTDFDAENEFVWKTLGGSKETWIGLTDGKMDKDPGDSTPYAWVTGEPLTLTNWNDNEPNHYNKNCSDNSSCYEHCAFILTDPAGKWNDELCEMTKQYVCEWDMGG